MLQLLSGGHCRLQPLSEEKDVYGLYSPRKGLGAPEATVPCGLVEAWRAQDWLEPDGGGSGRLRLSRAGRAWLRRRLARGDPFQGRRRALSPALVELAGALQPVLVNDAESPLAWLRRRRDHKGAPLISGPQFEAGMRLHRDFFRAQMGPRLIANLDEAAVKRRRRHGAPSCPVEAREDVLAARARVREALAAVGPEMAGLVFDVCCSQTGLEAAEDALGWPRRAGKVVLQIGLTRLARHYGVLPAEDGAGPVGRRLQHWGAEDFRPFLDG